MLPWRKSKNYKSEMQILTALYSSADRGIVACALPPARSAILTPLLADKVLKVIRLVNFPFWLSAFFLVWFCYPVIWGRPPFLLSSIHSCFHQELVVCSLVRLLSPCSSEFISLDLTQWFRVPALIPIEILILGTDVVQDVTTSRFRTCRLYLTVWTV